MNIIKLLNVNNQIDRLLKESPIMLITTQTTTYMFRPYSDPANYAHVLYFTKEGHAYVVTVLNDKQRYKTHSIWP